MKPRTWSILPLFAIISAACSESDVYDTSAPDDAFTNNPTVMNRVIPVRFVQYTNADSAALTSAQLDEQMDGLNAIFATAGLTFYRSDVQDFPSDTFSVMDGNYAWPTVLSSATPLAFHPSCIPQLPEAGSEDETMALYRAATYCARDGEVVVFTVASASQASGPYPWEANAILMPRGNMAAGNRTLAHEMGHYLGLSHSFKGAAKAYDLGNPNLRDPATNAAAKLSDFWDLVYKPSDAPPVTQSNVYFNNEEEAAGYPESSLRPIQGNAGWKTNPLGYACKTALGNCPAGTVEDTLRLAVPRTITEYGDCNAIDPAYSTNCLCVTSPASCDILFTGNSALKGLAFQALGHTQANPNLGANVMSYNYKPGFSGDQWGISVSQLLQIKRILTYDVPSQWFPGATGRRPLLGTSP